MTVPLCLPRHLSSENIGLGAHYADKNPIGTFLLELFQEPITTTPSPKCHHNCIGITTVQVKDLRQTIAIETGYGETNAWLEWIKYSVHTLNKSDYYACVAGRLEPRHPFPPGMAHRPCWNGMYDCSLP
jgi:hypothetical protein